MRNLPQLLRDAERRVNAHIWPNRVDTIGRDSHLASIPANRDTDTDLLLIEAADKIDEFQAACEGLLAKVVALYDMEVGAPEETESLDCVIAARKALGQVTPADGGEKHG